MAAGLGALACLMTMTAGLAACSSENEEPKQDDGRKLRQLTIENVALTRATLTDNVSTLGAAWKSGDAATYINLSTLPSLNSGVLTAASDRTSTSFTGSVTCTTGDRLALIYPAVSPAGVNGAFNINLSGQTGTLEDIAQCYHYVYGTGDVTSETESTATGTISSMKSLLAVCKFTFKDGSNNPIPVSNLKISYGGDLEAGYPQSYSLTPNINAESVNIPTNLTPSGSPLEVDLTENPASVVYVALLPCGSSSEKVTFFFSVTTGSNVTYTGTANAYLIAGRFYPVTITLTKQS